MKFGFCLLAFGLMLGSAQAQDLAPPVAGLGFLIGDWAGTGKSEHGTTDTGTSHIEAAVGGNGLLRRDHTDVTDASGKLVESFDQIMLIYPEGGTLHADYLDGAHIIHYTSATIVPGQSVTFATTTTADAPTFHLTYTKAPADALGIKFEMMPPGAPAFTTIAEGTVSRK